MITKSYLITTYIDRNLSMSEIAAELDCSVHKVEYWMKKHNIQRRNRSDATYIKSNPNGDPFKIKRNLTPEELQLKGLGIGIYWGEGNKKNLHSVRVGNTDPGLILTFVKFLRDICGVNEEKIVYGLQLFTDVDEKAALNYWMSKLNVQRSQIMPTISRISSGRIGSYKSKNQYGVITVYVNNVKLRNWIVQQLRCWSSSTVEQGHGKAQTRVQLSSPAPSVVINNVIC